MTQILLIYLSLGFTLLGAFTNENIYAMWLQHKIDHKLDFTEVEDEIRSNIFRDNLEFIEQHNKMASKFKLGINLFGHMTHQEYLNYISSGMKGKYLLKPTKYNKVKSYKNVADIDWRTKKAVTEIQEQGACGSCWAFSATAALEGQMALKRKKLVKLSEQELIDCSTMYNNYGCSGGYPPFAYDYVVAHGITNSSSYPYLAIDDTCHRNNITSTLTIKSYNVFNDGDESHLETLVGSTGPLSVGIDAHDPKFKFYQSGIFESTVCTTDRLSHGIAIVGLGSKPAKYYIIKNSWGKTWGDKGYGLFARGKDNMCGIASLYSYPVL